jgi:hypothetical protein
VANELRCSHTPHRVFIDRFGHEPVHVPFRLPVLQRRRRPQALIRGSENPLVNWPLRSETGLLADSTPGPNRPRTP